MSTENDRSRVLYQDLDTSFVNLWSLLRYLSQQAFTGRVHVELTNYAADVFLDGRETPLVHEIDRAAATDVVEEAALHRLVLRVRESPGKISVYQGADEAVTPDGSAEAPGMENTASGATPAVMRPATAKDDEGVTESALVGNSTAAVDLDQTIKLGGELIAAVDKAVTAQGANFAGLFQQARVTLGDDYTFLDPMSGALHYENSAVTMQGDNAPQGFVAGVSEALRRVVDQLASGDRARRTRERVALELARVARKNRDAITASGFREQLDRIAGTKVI